MYQDTSYETYLRTVPKAYPALSEEQARVTEQWFLRQAPPGAAERGYQAARAATADSGYKKAILVNPQYAHAETPHNLQDTHPPLYARVDEESAGEHNPQTITRLQDMNALHVYIQQHNALYGHLKAFGGIDHSKHQ